MPREGLFKLIYKCGDPHEARMYHSRPDIYPPLGDTGWFMAGRPMALDVAKREVALNLQYDAERQTPTGWKYGLVRVS